MNLSHLISRAMYPVGGAIGKNLGSVTILCYHALDSHNKYSVGILQFKKQIQMLTRTHTFISLDEYTSGKRLSPKKNYAVLTFDDGYKNILEVREFLNKLHITPTLFVLSDPQKADRHELDHKGQLLSWEDIKSLQNDGWIIGSHGATHADFARLSTKELIKEIYESKKVIEEKTGRSVAYFAYPKGIVNPLVKRIVKDAGYKYAFGISPLNAQKGKYRYEIPRYVVERSYSAENMHIKIAPSTLFLRRVFDRTVFIIS